MAESVSLFLDTTIQVDRLLKEVDPEKKEKLEQFLASYKFLLTSSYSRLEFKRVVIQNLGLCLRYLVEEKSFFRALNKTSALGQYRSRRQSTLISVLAWLGFQAGLPATEVDGSLDERLAMQCESYIRINILYIWKRFDKSVGSVVDRTECARAREEPKRTRTGTLLVDIPSSECRKRQCNNASFFQSNLPTIKKICRELGRLSARGIELSGELHRAKAEMELAVHEPFRLYDYKRCLHVGDVWVHLECIAAGIKILATTNYKESQHLCSIMDLIMHIPPHVATGPVDNPSSPLEPERSSA